MFNKVILMGRITHDLELKQTPNGVSVCTFSIAVDRRYQTKGEEKKTDFFNIVARRQTAEFVTTYFGKGRMILVEGELQTRSYVDKNGQNVKVTEIIADQVSFTGEKKPDAQTVPAAAPQAYAVPVQQTYAAPYNWTPQMQQPQQAPQQTYAAAQEFQDMATEVAKSKYPF